MASVGFVALAWPGLSAQAVQAKSVQVRAVICAEAALPADRTSLPEVVPAGCTPVASASFSVGSGSFFTGADGVAISAVAPGTVTLRAVQAPAELGAPSIHCAADSTTDADDGETFTVEDGAGIVSCVAYFVGTPGLSVVKTGPTEVKSGETVRYTITIRNTGSTSILNASLDDVATGLLNPRIVVQPEYLIAAGAACTGFPCNLFFIAAGQVKVFEVEYTVPPCTAVPPPLSNVATVTGSNGTSSSRVDINLTGCSVTTTTVAGATTTVAGATTTVAGATTTVAGATTTVAGATTTVAGATTTVAGATTTVAGATTTVAGATTTALTATPGVTLATTPAAPVTAAPVTAAPVTAAAITGAATTVTTVVTTTKPAVAGVTILDAPVASVKGVQIEEVPYTGANSSELSKLAFAMLLVGAGLILTGRLGNKTRRQ
jgi:hypothetical protein